MKVLVTGATGLVGVHTVAELVKHQVTVRALVRSKSKLLKCLEPFYVDTGGIEIVKGDITNTAQIPSYLEGCDALVHAAGIFSNDLADKDKLQKINIEATRHVLAEAAIQRMDPIIFISSYLALFPPEGEIMTERDEVKAPREMYARTKAEAERIARRMQADGAPVVSIYPGSIQGPHDPTYGIGSQILEQAIRGGKMLVTEGGRGYTDVRDLSQLIRRALVPGQGPRRYMFGGYFLKDAEVLGLLEKASRKKIKPIKVRGAVLRLIGSLLDVVARLSGKSFMLTREAAEVLTRSVPCDNSSAINELRLELVGHEKSFEDLVTWMRECGRI